MVENSENKCEQNISLEFKPQYSLIQENTQRTHRLLEGDNIFSLQYLVDNNERFDVIYIDPPYNTGNKNFEYVDSFGNSSVDKHQSWLSFMSPRLELAKSVLAEDGFIAVSINNKESHYLKVCMDGIFGEKNFIADIIWQNKAMGINSKHIDVITENVLVYAKNISRLKFTKREGNVKKFSYEDKHVLTRGRYNLENLSHKLHYSPGSDYPVKCPDGTFIHAGGVDKEQYEYRKANTKTRSHAHVWRWGRKKFEWGLQNDMIVFRKNARTGKWAVYTKVYEKVDNNLETRVNTMSYQNFIPSSFTRTSAGTKDIENVLGRGVFTFPKPVKLIKHLVNLHPSKDSRVLDFFAGSGTTGQAVLELNHEDNGSRIFVVCTNNENNIARNVTAKRIQSVLAGQWADGKEHESYPQDSLEYYMVRIDKNFDCTINIVE